LKKTTYLENGTVGRPSFVRTIADLGKKQARKGLGLINNRGQGERYFREPAVRGERIKGETE